MVRHLKGTCLEAGRQAALACLLPWEVFLNPETGIYSSAVLSRRDIFIFLSVTGAIGEWVCEASVRT